MNRGCSSICKWDVVFGENIFKTPGGGVEVFLRDDWRSWACTAVAARRYLREEKTAV